MWLATLADTHLGEDEMREVIEYLETKKIEACGTPAYKDPAARALKAGVLIVWDPDHLQAKRDGKGEEPTDAPRARVHQSQAHSFF